MALKVFDPSGEPAEPPNQLAPRVNSLAGRVVWILDGFGAFDGEHQGQTINKVFQAWKDRIEHEYEPAEIHYARTDNIGTPYRHGKETFERVIREADVVINGVAL